MMDLTPWSSGLLLLLAEQAPSATQAFVPSLSRAYANVAVSSTTSIARRRLPEFRQFHVGRSIQPSLRMARTGRDVHATIMDVDGPESSANRVSKEAMATAEVTRREIPWQPVEARATVDLPSVEMPLDLPQPGEWLNVPLGSPPPSRSNQASLSVKADPFAVPDNVYRDSWLDSLWIKLFSSRMSAAVEAEARERCGLLLAGGESAAAGNTSSARRTSAKEEGGGEGEGRTIGATMESSAAAANGNTGRSNGAAAVVVGSLNSGVSVEGGVRVGYTYKDYVDLATRLQAGPPERQRQVVRGVLRSIFPAWFPAFYRTLFPVSKFSAQVNAFMCPPLFTWLVGKSELTDGAVDLKGVEGAGPTQEVWRSTVKVERCRYLEASKCKGTCMNLCKLPTEAFFREDLGMPLRMTPNFEDLSCEFAFGQAAAPVEDDPLMQEPCWTECLNSGKQPKSGPQRACHTMPESPLKS